MTESNYSFCLEEAAVDSDARKSSSPQTGWRLAIKVVMDRAIAALALLLLSPVLLLVALLVAIYQGTPILFRQQRPGRFGRPFTLIKFRTMSNRRDGAGNLLPDSERLTRLGRVLRSTSIDELLQLWNVLRGNLSLVGPRPLLMSYLPLYSPEQARRHNVLPGITGWAQVNGRNALTWEDKFKLDIWYVDNWSLWLDLQIMIRTIGYVLTRRGISNATHATMPEFFGNSTPADSQHCPPSAKNDVRSAQPACARPDRPLTASALSSSEQSS